MALEAAVFGFAGVLVGSAGTSIVTIYKEVITTRREAAQRDRQYERERTAARDTFQREKHSGSTSYGGGSHCSGIHRAGRNDRRVSADNGVAVAAVGDSRRSWMVGDDPRNGVVSSESVR